MNTTFLSQIPKLQSFIADLNIDTTVDLMKLHNFIDLRIQQTSISLNEVLHFYEYCQSTEFLKMHSSRNWTDEEWKVLLWVISQYCIKSSKEIDNFVIYQHKYQVLEDWINIAEIIAFKDALNCQFKWFTHLRIVSATKNWTAQEDKLLYRIMTKEPNIKWFEVQYEMFIESEGQYFRKAKQYRERWNNYLNPQVNRGIWTEADDFNLLSLSLEEGLRWSNISKKLKNRTENQVKNRFKSLINKERKIIHIPAEILQTSNEDTGKHGLDKMTEFLIHSILSRLKPVQKQQNSQSSPVVQQEQQQPIYTPEQPYNQYPQYPIMVTPQQYYFQQFQQIPQIQPMMQAIPIAQPQQTQQQYPQQPLSIQIPNQSLIQQQLLQQQFLQQPMMTQYYPNQFIPQNLIQQQQQYKFNVYSSQQNTPTNSIGSLGSQKSEKLISDQIKEEENSGSSSNKEPKVQKLVCVSAKSSINGSTSSINSMDAIKQNFNNMHIDSEQNSPDELQKRKHQRSQSGAFDISNQGKMKTKRSRFYHASNDG